MRPSAREGKLEEVDPTARARIGLQETALRTILLVAGIGTVAYLLVSAGMPTSLWKRLPPALFAIVCLWLARRPTFRHLQLLSWSFLLAFWALATYGLYTGGGVFGSASYTLFLVIICAGFVGGARAVMVMTPLALLSIVAIFTLGQHGLLPEARGVLSHPSMLFSLLLQVTAGGLLVGLASSILLRLVAQSTTALSRVQESEERLRAFYESAFEGIVLSREGIIIDFNRRAAEIVGYPAETLIGRQIADFIPDDQIEMVRDRLRRDDGEVYEHDVVSADGERIPVRVQTRNFFIGGERLRATVFEDLRKERALEAEQARLAARARVAQRLEAVGTLAAGVAHEFNNLLAGILAYLDLAEMGLEEVRAADLREARKVALRGKDLIQQILTSSRKTTSRREIVDLGEVAKDVARMLRATLPKTVEIEVEAEKGCLIVGDASAMHQVILNLATNAAHAMPEERGHLAIRVEAREPEGPSAGEPFVSLRVADDGQGMDEKTREQCFEPFFTTKPRGRGTGMGLAVVRGVVQAHGGSIEIESAPGEGTTFFVDLPAAPRQALGALDAEEAPGEGEEAVEQEAARGDEVPARGSGDRSEGGRVLFLDDESALAEAMSRLLRRFGFEVETFDDPVEAAEAIEARPEGFDVFVTDYSMPELSGIEVIRRLRTKGVETPIILCSGNPDLLPPEALSDLEVHAILRKPVSPKVLAETLDRVIGRGSRPEPPDPP